MNTVKAVFGGGKRCGGTLFQPTIFYVHCPYCGFLHQFKSSVDLYSSQSPTSQMRRHSDPGQMRRHSDPGQMRRHSDPGHPVRSHSQRRQSLRHANHPDPATTGSSATNGGNT